MLTNEVVRVEEVIVPDLHGEDGRQVPLSLSQTVEVILTLMESIIHVYYIAPIIHSNISTTSTDKVMSLAKTTAQLSKYAHIHNVLPSS